jgi:hypothetical protein
MSPRNPVALSMVVAARMRSWLSRQQAIQVLHGYQGKEPEQDGVA